MSIKEIFDAMSYGPAPESSAEAFAWIASHNATFGHWILASMGLLVAAVMVVVIVPLVIVLAVVLPLIAGAFGMAVGLLALAAAMSPVILLAWWLWRRSRSPAAAPDGTTMRP